MMGFISNTKDFAEHSAKSFVFISIMEDLLTFYA